MNRSPIALPELHELPVTALKGVGEARAKGLREFEIETVLDLLMHYPRRYLDRTKEARIDELVEGEAASVLVTVESTTSRRLRGNRVLVTSTVSDRSGRLKLTFFNQRWRERQLASGQQAYIYGKLEFYRNQRQMTNPVVDMVGDQVGRIIPVYPQSEKSSVYSRDVSEWVAEALRRTLSLDGCSGRGLLEPLSVELRAEHGLVDRETAFYNIHRPEAFADQVLARKRLVFDELFRMQLALVLRKRLIEATSVGITHTVDGKLLQQFTDSLPFPLTGAQERAIAEIQRDLKRPIPMNRLLQGDVGAGKTLVAVAAMLTAADGQHQAALMAPTEVLAEQHYLGIRRLLDGMTVEEEGSLFSARPLSVELLTNRVTTSERKRILSGLVTGTVDIIIGTHALIQETVMFHSLGVVVIDEQHRFGVEQRAALKERTTGDEEPDVLVMTATPIPRTAAMTVYGDLDVSVLDELPPGRTPITTHWVRASGRLGESSSEPADTISAAAAAEAEEALERMWGEVRVQINEGRQVYVVCPLIDQSETIEVASAEDTHQRLSTVELEGARVGLLHGRLHPNEKEQTMDEFRRGDLDVLVATTVIEVGVDVPNATVMIILDADRFGIAQLHQLRGRVGRGQHRSTCWLVGEATTPDGESRMEALVESTDGFYLAEVDLDLRGEGTILGERQKGRSDLRLASLRRDRDVVIDARRAAVELVDSDPELAHNDVLREELAVFLDEEDAAFLSKG